MDETRALLDELMGKDRNKPSTAKPSRGTHFSDPEVCKHFLCAFCPNELFTNTKSDLGTCTKIHDETLKSEYQRSGKKDQYPYEREFGRYLERLIDDLDRRIKRGHERLDVQDGPAPVVNNERVKATTDKIQILLRQIEDLGERGRIEESQALMKMVDALKTEKEAMLSNDAYIASSPLEKRMKVCEICGAFLVVGDTDKRVQSHMEGKQHIGYALIRKTIHEYRIKFKDSEREERKGPKREEREKDPREIINRDRDRGNRDRGYDRRRRERSISPTRDRERRRERDDFGDDYERDSKRYR
jgi:hypothetical protein